VEAGTVTLIGATTENPSFEVIAPLLSRSRVFVLEPLGEEDLVQILRRALAAGDGVPLDLDAAARWFERAEQEAEDPALAAYARAALAALAGQRSHGAESGGNATAARNSK
ncbi:MAG: replication-associated recombination protein A, partial [Rhodothalassiaceae bacterium]